MICFFTPDFQFFLLIFVHCKEQKSLQAFYGVLEVIFSKTIPQIFLCHFGSLCQVYSRLMSVLL